MSGSVNKFLKVRGFSETFIDGFDITIRISEIIVIADMGEYREIQMKDIVGVCRTYESYETLVAALSQ